MYRFHCCGSFDSLRLPWLASFLCAPTSHIPSFCWYIQQYFIFCTNRPASYIDTRYCFSSVKPHDFLYWFAVFYTHRPFSFVGCWLTHQSLQDLDAITTSMRMVAEGVKTAASVDALSTKMGVEMPICQQVFEASGSASGIIQQPFETKVWLLY